MTQLDWAALACQTFYGFGRLVGLMGWTLVALFQAVRPFETSCPRLVEWACPLSTLYGIISYNLAFP